MQEKTHLRTRFKEERKKLNIAGISDEIVHNIRTSDFYKRAQHVMLFYPLRYEISLLDLLNDDKQFYFPRVDDEKLLVCPYDSGCRFDKSCFNIYEPCSEPVNPDIIDLVFVPALAADKDNFRLGYGGGYYDRFLVQTKAFKVCPIYEGFVVEKLPHENFDIPVDCIITNGKRPTVK